jgi:phosphoribosyl-AMP cyclohydrolase
MELMNFDKLDGLVTAIAQDHLTGEVLMVAFMNEEAWKETLATRRACYYSRSRRRLWRKGEESGNIQIVKEVLVDCDRDAVVLKVEQVGGAACHTGYNSCFYTRINPDGSEEITKAEKVFDPAAVYGRKG